MISSSRSGRYWQGNIATYQDELEQEFNDLLQATSDVFADFGDFGAFGDLGDLGDVGALLGELFGGGSPDDEIRVRVTKAGEDTVAGYSAERYTVETSRGDDWRVFEEIWISSDLLKEVAAEASACVDIMSDVSSEISSAIDAFGIDEMEAVLASPDYQALLKRGYPVRIKQTMRGLFGETVESISEVVDVIKGPISEDAFIVPSGYRRVDSFFEVFDM